MDRTKTKVTDTNQLSRKVDARLRLRGQYSTAAGHFNPAGKKHGLNSPAGAHAGDLPNMLVAKDGSGRFEVRTDAITLKTGAASVFDSDGSALIIHAGVDDYATDPAGNAGDRAACGPIVATN